VHLFSLPPVHEGKVLTLLFIHSFIRSFI